MLCMLIILKGALAPWSYTGINFFGYAGRSVDTVAEIAEIPFRSGQNRSSLLLSL